MATKIHCDQCDKVVGNRYIILSANFKYMNDSDSEWKYYGEDKAYQELFHFCNGDCVAAYCEGNFNHQKQTQKALRHQSKF